MLKIAVINQLLCCGSSKSANALKKKNIANAKISQVMIGAAAKYSDKHLRN